MCPQTVEIYSLEDLDLAAASVGLPVGPRTGPVKRTKEKKEWYVLLGFLKAAIPAGMIELPIVIRNGQPPNEPDFVAARGDLTIGLFEVTEATDETDQQEMTASERSDTASMPGDFGGRFADGASQPGLVWAADIVEAIRRKSGKVIFRISPAARHLIVYPNSNASFLLFNEDHEREAVEDLRAEIIKDAAALSHEANRCLVHVLGKHLLCFDALGEMTILSFGQRPDC
jgi:hypothetical protein